jgi:hypothetical protein
LHSIKDKVRVRFIKASPREWFFGYVMIPAIGDVSSSKFAMKQTPPFDAIVEGTPEQTEANWTELVTLVREWVRLGDLQEQ